LRRRAETKQARDQQHHESFHDFIFLLLPESTHTIRPDIALIEKFSNHTLVNFAGAKPPLWIGQRIAPALVTSQG
jgi:hypothetical protein